MKIFIYVTDIGDALKGDFTWSLNASSSNELEDGTNWFLVGEVDVDLNINRDKFTKIAVEKIEEAETKLKAETAAKLTQLERQKQELFAITYQP